MTGNNDSVDEDVAAALADAFPERDVEDVRPGGPSWNAQNETVRVDFSNGESRFLKVAVDGDGSRITRECAVIDYVNTHCDVTVPSVIKSETDSEPYYLVTAPMREQSLAPQWVNLSRSERTATLRQIGTALADVHAQRFERHGHIVDGSADGLTLDTGSWTDVLVERIEILREIGTSDRFEYYYDEVSEVVEANRERLADAPAALVHGDPAMPNIFRSETTLGFVDWEIAHVGDPARGLHRAQNQLLESRDLGQDEQLVGALHDGYRRRAGSLPAGLDDRTPIYNAVRYLGTVGFFDKIAVLSDQPTEEVAAQVTEEMDKRLNAIR